MKKLLLRNSLTLFKGFLISAVIHLCNIYSPFTFASGLSFVVSGILAYLLSKNSKFSISFLAIILLLPLTDFIFVFIVNTPLSYISGFGLLGAVSGILLRHAFSIAYKKAFFISLIIVSFGLLYSDNFIIPRIFNLNDKSYEVCNQALPYNGVLAKDSTEKVLYNNGHPYFIQFWNRACRGCKEQEVWLEKIKEQLGTDAMYYVNTATTNAFPNRFQDSYHRFWEFASKSDREYFYDFRGELFGLAKFNMIPIIYLVDGNNHVREIYKRWVPTTDRFMVNYLIKRYHFYDK